MTVMAAVIAALCATPQPTRTPLNMSTEPKWPDVSTYDRALQIGRTNWQTILPVDDVRGYAETAAKYHRLREEWWHTQAEDVKETIGVSGLEVREQPITGGMRHDIVIDPALIQRLNECETKSAGHRNKAEALERFQAFLSASHGPLTLTAADADFFEVGQHLTLDVTEHSASDLGRTEL